MKEKTQYQQRKEYTRGNGVSISIQNMERVVKILEESKDKQAPQLLQKFKHWIMYYSC